MKFRWVGILEAPFKYMLAIYMQIRGVIDDMIGIAYNQLACELDFIGVVAAN